MANSYDITVMRKLEKQIEELLAESQRYRTALEKIEAHVRANVAKKGVQNRLQLAVDILKLLPREGK